MTDCHAQITLQKPGGFSWKCWVSESLSLEITERVMHSLMHAAFISTTEAGLWLHHGFQHLSLQPHNVDGSTRVSRSIALQESKKKIHLKLFTVWACAARASKNTPFTAARVGASSTRRCALQQHLSIKRSKTTRLTGPSFWCEKCSKPRSTTHQMRQAVVAISR